MSCMDNIHGFRTLNHPLSQITAASEFCEHANAFIEDTWSELYSDDPPEEVDFGSVLDGLASLGLRFEMASAPEPEEDSFIRESFWSYQFQGGALNALLYGWANRMLEFLESDHRVFFHALQATDLVFIPDEERMGKKAYDLALSAESNEIYDLEEKREAFAKSQSLSHDDGFAHVAAERGEGPRVLKPAMIDRAAILLRKKAVALSPETIAAEIGEKNLGSLTAALHQVVKNGKPKRLRGWVQKEEAGLYRWNGDS